MGTEVLATLKEMPQLELRRKLFDAEADVRLIRAVLRERNKLDAERERYEDWLQERQGKGKAG